MTDPEPFAPEYIPFDVSAPQHRWTSACRTTITKDSIICTCGFQAFKPDDTLEKSQFKKYQTEKIPCIKCKKPFTRRINTQNTICSRCKKQEYNETQRAKRERENRKMGMAGKLKARMIP